MEEFYSIYEPTDEPDPTRGDIPALGKTAFRKWILATGFTFGTVAGRTVAVQRQKAGLDLINYLREIRK